MEKIITDRDEALEAVREDGMALKYVSEELRYDREIVISAVKENYAALDYVPYELHEELEDELEEEMEKNNERWEFCEEEEYEILAPYREALEAVREDGLALQYVSEEMRDEFDVVLEAVKNNPDALQYASDKLRNDMEIVSEAIKRSPAVIRYIGEELRGSQEFVAAFADIIFELEASETIIEEVSSETQTPVEEEKQISLTVLRDTTKEKEGELGELKDCEEKAKMVVRKLGRDDKNKDSQQH